jgi:GNAT superfamily N-acetyltransferase
MSDPEDGIMRDVSLVGRIRANEVSLVHFFDVLARLAGEVLDEPDLYLFITRLPFAFFNGVVRSSLTTETADARIALAQARLRQHGVPGTWWITPTSTPADLERHLLAHGFKDPYELPCMSLDLETLADGPAPLPEAVTIERVRDAEQLRASAEVVMASFDLSAAMTEQMSALLMRLDVSAASPTQIYLARLDGEPVATSLLFLSGGVAGLYNIATLAHARNRGIGAAVTLAPLRDARALGYRLAVLQASEMGAPVYRRLGFQEDFRPRLFEWRPG